MRLANLLSFAAGAVVALLWTNLSVHTAAPGVEPEVAGPPVDRSVLPPAPSASLPPPVVGNLMRRLLLGPELSASGVMGNIYEQMVFQIRRKNFTVVDVGLHHGGETLLSMVHGLRVFAFEPHPVSCANVRNAIANATACYDEIARQGLVVDARRMGMYRPSKLGPPQDGRDLLRLPAPCMYLPDKESNLRTLGGRLRRREGMHVPVLHCAAASNVSGAFATLHAAADGHAQSSANLHQALPRYNRSLQVPLLRVDDVVDEPVLLLKIDTQGHELQVLQGAEGLVRRHGVEYIIMEYSPGLLQAAGTDPVRPLELVRSWGYHCFDLAFYSSTWRGGASINPIHSSLSFADLAATLLHHRAWTDLLCVVLDRPHP